MALEPQGDALLKPLPFRIQLILVPVDFSETAKKALQYAIQFAAGFDAEVVLLHVMEPYLVPPEMGYLPPQLAVNQQELEDSAREGLDKLCASEIGTRIRAQTKVRVGVPWVEIVSTAEETQADLIILATHGRTGLKHIFMGSVAERVVRHAPCPVLVVREKERDFIPAEAKGQ